MAELRRRPLVALCLFSAAAFGGCQTSTPMASNRALFSWPAQASARSVQESGSWSGASYEPGTSKMVAKADTKAANSKGQQQTATRTTDPASLSSMLAKKLPPGPPLPLEEVIQTTSLAKEEVKLPAPKAPPVIYGADETSPASATLPTTPVIPPPLPLLTAQPVVVMNDKPAPAATLPREAARPAQVVTLPVEPVRVASECIGSASVDTVHLAFGHAPDYSWISGETQRWRNEWRLRYGAVDEIDIHGGSVTLAGEEHFDKLREGEHYRMRGRLVANSAKTGGAVFYIDAVEPIH